MGALAGIKVVEFGNGVAVGYCGALLAVCGAEVIKVEAPGQGGKRVRLLYVLHRSAKIPKRFRFYEDAERITRQVSPKLFRKNFSPAIRTARR